MGDQRSDDRFFFNSFYYHNDQNTRDLWMQGDTLAVGWKGLYNGNSTGSTLTENSLDTMRFQKEKTLRIDLSVSWHVIWVTSVAITPKARLPFQTPIRRRLVLVWFSKKSPVFPLSYSHWGGSCTSGHEALKAVIFQKESFSSENDVTVKVVLCIGRLNLPSFKVSVMNDCFVVSQVHIVGKIEQLRQKKEQFPKASLLNSTSAYTQNFTTSYCWAEWPKSYIKVFSFCFGFFYIIQVSRDVTVFIFLFLHDLAFYHFYRLSDELFQGLVFIIIWGAYSVEKQVRLAPQTDTDFFVCMASNLFDASMTIFINTSCFDCLHFLMCLETAGCYKLINSEWNN